jgi:hypothetical protein
MRETIQRVVLADLTKQDKIQKSNLTGVIRFLFRSQPKATEKTQFRLCVDGSIFNEKFYHYIVYLSWRYRCCIGHDACALLPTVIT